MLHLILVISDNVLVSNNTNAPIVGPDGETYLIPREGYPVRSGANNVLTLPRFLKIGFRGTFDGQGYVISNYDGSDGRVLEGAFTYYVDDVLNTASSTKTMGAGIFGVITGEATVKNVAFKGVYIDWSPILAFEYFSPRNAIINEGDCYTARRLRIESIFVSTKEARTWGTLVYIHDGVGYDFEDCFFDVTSIGSGNNLKGGVIGTDNQWTQTNDGLKTHANDVYVAVVNNNMSGAVGGVTTATQNSSGTRQFPAITDVNGEYVYDENGTQLHWEPVPNYDIDVTFATSVEELYTATTNSHKFGFETQQTMAEAFAGNKNFVVTQDGKVYWKRIYETSLTLSATSVELADKNATAEVTLSYSGNAVTPDSVTLDSNILKYENGVISVVNHVPGTYEVVFNYNGAEVVLEVVLSAVTKDAYLQEDGELVAHGLNSIVGKYFTVNGTEVDATMFNGKIKLDIAGLGLTAPTTQAGSATVDMYGDFGKEITFNCQYVSLAIDEAEDLKHFNVGYTFDATEYKNATDKVAYLANCQANPFDYYEGYYVLLKDIDASGIVFEHEAVVAPTITNGGFALADSSYVTSFTATNPMAQDYDGNGIVDEVEANYFIPRSGYPINNGLNLVFNHKIGFRGVFNGQGHIITNLNDTVRNPVKYYQTGDTTEMTGTAYDVGAGLFGVLQSIPQIKNVAFVNLHVSKSGGLSMYTVSRNKLIGAITTGRPSIYNAFFKTAESEVNYGIISSKTESMHGVRELFVVVDATSHTSLAPSASKLIGGINGGDRADKNTGLNTIARYVYVAAQKTELNQGFDNVQEQKVWNVIEVPASLPTTNTVAVFPTTYKALQTSIFHKGTLDTLIRIGKLKELITYRDTGK